MKRHLLVLFTLTGLYAGCGGPKHTELPDIEPSEFVPPEAAAGEDCEFWSFTVKTELPNTPVPFPFSGSRETPININRPSWYGRKVVYPMAVSWNAGGYVQEATFSDAGTRKVFAVFSSGEFVVDPSVDMTPFFYYAEEDRVEMMMLVWASGTKPAGKQRIDTLVTVRVCDPVNTTPPEVEQRPTLTPGEPEVEEVKPKIRTPEGCPSC